MKHPNTTTTPDGLCMDCQHWTSCGERQGTGYDIFYGWCNLTDLKCRPLHTCPRWQEKGSTADPQEDTDPTSDPPTGSRSQRLDWIWNTH